VQRILVTGGCGFIGSHLVRRLLREHPALELVNLDLLTYAGRPENLADVADDARYRFVQGDIADADAVAEAAEGCDAIINAAAETHVDRSIMGGDEFVNTNILGAKRLLDWVATHEGVRLLHVSTDEVYGDVEAPHRSREGDHLHGSSPYAAAKAAAELMVFAYVRTYGINASIVRGANAYGPNQFPEKFIPVLAINTLEGRPLPVYGDGRQVREFTHVSDFAAGIEAVLLHGKPGEAYNCGSEEAQVNLETARRVVEILEADEELIQHVADRPGHDRRYAIDCTKLRALGWAPRVGFAAGLRETVEWYRANEAWWRAIQAGADYTSYVAANYGGRAGA
jgi:dTDP-glucose 4,6-dehydratase